MTDVEPPRRGKRRVADWTEENIELLRSMWLSGHSASLIAKAIGNGCTRNAVIGKVDRMDLVRDPSCQRQSLPKPVAAIVAAEVARLDAPPPPPPPEPIAPVAPPPLVVLVEHEPEQDEAPSLYEMFGPFGIRIMDLKPESCRYIAGDPVDAIYCGQRIVTGSRYCGEHTALCGGRKLPRKVSDAVYKQRAKTLAPIIARG